MKLLKDEINSLLEVYHDRIMKIVEVIEDSKYYCIVSEIIKGGMLIDRLLSIG